MDDEPRQPSVTAETILSTLAHLYAYEGKPREVAILADAEGEIQQTGHDPWNGGRYGYAVTFYIPQYIYGQIVSLRDGIEQAFTERTTPLFAHNEWLDRVSLKPQRTEDLQWRDRARAWLAGSGINNQGRVRSDNIASRECDGLLFRSEPEILLYRALKSLGVSFAPLPVFVRGGSTYRRVEPDFVIVKGGLLMVVEVDGDTVHHETPAEAHDRTTMLAHEGVHIERIKASQSDTPEKAAETAKALVGLFDKLRASR
jgi:hypothetical protein